MTPTGQSGRRRFGASEAGRAAPKRRPAVFCAGRLARQLLFCLILAWPGPASLASSAAAQGYRLAGTMSVATDFLAFLETPGNVQVLVRRGDVVGKALVRDIRDREIDLAVAGGVLTLSLDGSDRPIVGNSSHEVVVNQSSEDNFLRREVAVEPFGKAVANAGRTASGAPTALGQRIAPVLDLPLRSRVLAVDGHAVTSSDAAVREISAALAAGVTVTLNLETPVGFRRVYLAPQQTEPLPNVP